LKSNVNDNGKTHRFRLELILVTEKKLNVGAGALSPKIKADVPLIHLPGEKCLIPGSTIKGILRTSLIRLLNTLGEKTPPTVHPSSLIDSNDMVGMIFGRPGKPGKIFVYGAILERDSCPITHVKIDDDTRTVAEGALYTVEYLPIGTEFTCRIEGELTIDELEYLLLSILEARYERIGKSGLVSFWIDKKRSELPVEESELIKEIVEVIGIERRESL